MKQAVLAVSFGTSYLNTLDKTIAASEQAIAAAFPDWDLRRAFTSGMIIRKLKQRDGIYIDTPQEALEKLIAEGYSRVILQPTHIMHGEEFEKVVAAGAAYADRIRIRVGMPLLHCVEDYHAVSNALFDWVGEPEKDEALIYMGHGSEHFANPSYSQLEYCMRTRNDRVFIATVEGYPTLKEVMQKLSERPDIKRIHLHPLMLVAGDHATNDMAGEDDSWAKTLTDAGYEVTCTLRGMGECPAIQQMFAEHACKAREEMCSCSGKLTGVGVGPGDPELLTIKAVRVLREADVILVPDTGRDEKVALNIVSEYIKDKQVEFVETPMMMDRTKVNESYDRCANKIARMLQEKKQVAFITLGDPTIYSTYLYVHQRVQMMGYDVEIIPGIPSFCAAAAKLNMTLCEGREPLLIIPRAMTDDEEVLKSANRIYMKSGKGILELKEELRKKGTLSRTSLAANVGLPGELILPKMEDMTDPTGYFSIVIEKCGGCGE